MAKITVLTCCSTDQDVNLSLIRIKKPYIANDNIHIFDISHGDNALALQTSACVVPYSYYVFDNKSFQFDVHTCDITLKQLLSNINEYILGKIRKYNRALLNDKLFLDYVKEVRKEPRCEYRIRLRNVNTNNISVFDKNNGHIDITTLQTFDKVSCLFQIQKLIVQKETYYFQASIVQIKKMNTPLLVLRECLIEDIQDSDDGNDMENNTSCEHDKTDIVPLDMVEHKRQLGKRTNEQQAKNHMSMCLEQLKKGVSLNSKIRDEVPKKDVESSDISPHGQSLKVFAFRPPSLSDILQARTNLKPVT
jgi:hypothetical protein